MENTQQQPTMLSVDDLLSKMVAPTQAQEEKPKEEVLPEPPKQEEVPTLEAEPKAKVQKEEVVKTKSNYSNKIQTLLDTGFVDNFSITLDGEEVYLSDLEIEDEEVFNTILSQIKAEKDNKLKENYISKEGLDETTQKLIEIKKAGGDITEIIKKNVKAIDQLSDLKTVLDEGEDAEKEQLSIDILARDLKQKGLEDEVIEAQIRVYISKGELEDRATKVLDNHLSLHQQEIENKKQQELERIIKEKEESKTFRKNLSAKYKELTLPENISKVLIDNATKENALGITNTDDLYFQLRNSKDPKDIEKFAKINYAINNLDAFEDWISGKKVTKAKAQEIYKSSIVVNTGKTKAVESRNSVDDILSSMIKQ